MSGGRAAWKGGIERSVLEAHLADGWSIRRMAAELGVSYATVRHWLGAYGLQTVRGRRLKTTRAARESGLSSVEAECPVHGMVQMVPRGHGAFRCLRCRSEAVVQRQRKVKQLLVADAGGACRLCGYAEHVAALQFHHREPEEKAFSISAHGMSRSLARARAEAAKCTLLCANCHAAVEAGALRLPLPPARTVPDGHVPDPG